MDYTLDKFIYQMEDNFKSLEMLGAVDIRASEYRVAEDEYGHRYAFMINDEEELELVTNDQMSDFIIQKWEEEAYGTNRSGNVWDDDDEFANVSEDEEEAIEDRLSYVDEFSEDE